VKRVSDLGSNEGQRALIVTQAAAREEIEQPQAERLPVVKPPIHGLALRLDAVASAKLD
jgi:hypothetical protein